jgi:hypothetical protein
MAEHMAAVARRTLALSMHLCRSSMALAANRASAYRLPNPVYSSCSPAAAAAAAGRVVANTWVWLLLLLLLLRLQVRLCVRLVEGITCRCIGICLLRWWCTRHLLLLLLL